MGAWGQEGSHKDCGFYTEGNEDLVVGFEQRKVNIQLTSKVFAWAAIWTMARRVVRAEGGELLGHCSNPCGW